MAVRPVLRYPDPVLKRPAESVGRIDEAARTVARDLVDTMRAAPATVGLAAQQIGSAELIEMPTCHHQVPDEEPEQFYEALGKFLGIDAARSAYAA